MHGYLLTSLQKLFRLTRTITKQRLRVKKCFLRGRRAHRKQPLTPGLSLSIHCHWWAFRVRVIDQRQWRVRALQLRVFYFRNLKPVCCIILKITEIRCCPSACTTWIYCCGRGSRDLILKIKLSAEDNHLHHCNHNHIFEPSIGWTMLSSTKIYIAEHRVKHIMTYVYLPVLSCHWHTGNHVPSRISSMVRTRTQSTCIVRGPRSDALDQNFSIRGCAGVADVPESGFSVTLEFFC